MTAEGGQAQHGDVAIRLKVIPLSDFYRADDPRHESESFELQRALSREFPGALEVRSSPGTKGGLTELIITVATGPTIAGLVDVFKAWLASRPVHRTINLEYEVEEHNGKRKGTLRVDSSNVESQQLAMITGEAFKSKG